MSKMGVGKQMFSDRSGCTIARGRRTRHFLHDKPYRIALACGNPVSRVFRTVLTPSPSSTLLKTGPFGHLPSPFLPFDRTAPAL